MFKNYFRWNYSYFFYLNEHEVCILNYVYFVPKSFLTIGSIKSE